jgi:hypothetical protein
MLSLFLPSPWKGEGPGVRLSPQPVVISPNCNRVGMLGTENLLGHGNGSLLQRFGFGVPSHRFVQPRQVVQAGGNIGMLRSPVLLERTRVHFSPSHCE